MTRIDPQGPGVPLRDGSAGTTSRASGVRVWGCGGCALLFLFASAFAVFAAVYVVAKVGAVRVPVLSQVVYRPVDPVRDVAELSGYSVQDVLASVGARARFNAGTGEISSFIGEEELTTLVAKGLRETGDGTSSLDDVQVAIGRDGLEFSGTLAAWDGGTLPVIIRATPSVKDGALVIDVARVALGSLELPRFAVSALFAAAGESFVRAMNEALADVGRLRGIVLEEGRMNIRLSPHAQ